MSSLARLCIRYIFLLVSIQMLAMGVGAADNLPVLEPVVSTIAGNGALGVRNGPALTSSFIEPDGVAVGPDGTIYVADGGAQEIRRIQHGVVERVAGHSSPGIDPQQREGGFADGPVQTALFNRPVSIAVGKDGALYVADLANFRIRKIHRGVVSTFAGSGVHGKSDGVGAAAQFSFPKSVAVDDDGNIYVADVGNGVRKVTPSGVVTTIAANATVYVVSVRGAGKNLTLAYTAADGIHFTSPTIQDIYPPEKLREPDHEGVSVGYAHGIAIVSNDAIVITDLMHSAVRYLRFEGFPLSRALAGGVWETGSPVGGYRDGPSDVARMDVPLGVARASDGAIYVADTGNRRIREISGLDVRTATADLSGLGTGDVLRSEYRIVVLGNSFVFHNVLWPESIPGQIDAGLMHDGASLGLHRKPRVVCIRLNGSDIFTQHSFVSTYLSDGEADLVVLVGNGITHGYGLRSRPDLNVGEKWRVVEPHELRSIASDLKKGGTKFLYVYVPNGSSLSQVEEAQEHLGLNGLLAPHYDVMSDRAADQDIENMYLSSGVKMLPLIAPMVRAEAEPNRFALFNTRDEHPSPEGQLWIGRTILKELERWKPWQGEHS